MSGCIGIRLRTIRLSAEQLPAAKYSEYKSLICAMGVFRSQTPRALINAACNNYCPAYDFHLGRIRPVFMPVSVLFFFLTTVCLFRFLLFSARFNLVFSPGYIPDHRSMAFLPNTILSPDSFPFLSVPNAHPPVLPCIPHSEILYQSISPSTITRICRFHSYNLIFLLSLHDSPFQISPCLCLTGACHAPVLITKEELPSETLRHSTSARYSFLARSRSSSVGAVLNFPYRSRMTILSSFFSNPCLISFSQLPSSTK